MASTVVFTAAHGAFKGANDRMAVYTFDCTTHTDQTCTGHAQNIAEGWICQVDVIPDTGGTKPSPPRPPSTVVAVAAACSASAATKSS